VQIAAEKRAIIFICPNMRFVNLRALFSFEMPRLTGSDQQLLLNEVNNERE
jgi:hypothetical protein